MNGECREVSEFLGDSGVDVLGLLTLLRAHRGFLLEIIQTP